MHSDQILPEVDQILLKLFLPFFACKTAIYNALAPLARSFVIILRFALAIIPEASLSVKYNIITDDFCQNMGTLTY